MMLWFSGGCAPTPPQLTLPSLVAGTPAFRATVEGSLNSPIANGNKVTVLLNGEEIFPAMLKAIRSALKTITYEEYVFKKSEIGRTLIEAFAERCQAGVQVAVLLDAYGSSNLPRQYAEMLRGAGCEVVEDFRSIRPWTLGRNNHRTHRRILVVDSRIGFTGGYVVGSAWKGDAQQNTHWRDTNVQVEGPVVRQLQAAFAAHWREATGALLGGEGYYPSIETAASDAAVRAQIVSSSPLYQNYSVFILFMQAISAARRSIDITNPYAFLDGQLMTALIQARQRGVSVRIILPARLEDNVKILVGQQGYGPLLEAGIELHEFQDSFLHAKTMVIDGIWSTIGTSNFDNRSMAINDEIQLVIYDAGVAQRMEEIFSDDLGQSCRLTLQDWRNRGVMTRFMSVLGAPFYDQL